MSQAFGVPINDSFGKEQEPALVRAMAKLEGTVLVSWSRETVLKVLCAMGVHCALPDEWPDDRCVACGCLIECVRRGNLS